MHHEAHMQVTLVYSCKLLKLNKISITCSFFQFSAKHLPTELFEVYDAFHISMLKKYVADRSHVLQYEPLEVRVDTTYVEQLIGIVDTKLQVLRNMTIN